MKHLLILVGIFLLLLAPGDAFACTCANPLPPRKELKKARAVFVGEVLEVKELTSANKLAEGKFLFAVRFRVDQYWKGITTPEVTILTDMPLGDCGRLNFED